jgi:hypothetical protein
VAPALVAWTRGVLTLGIRLCRLRSFLRKRWSSWTRQPRRSRYATCMSSFYGNLSFTETLLRLCLTYTLLSNVLVGLHACCLGGAGAWVCILICSWQTSTDASHSRYAILKHPECPLHPQLRVLQLIYKNFRRPQRTTSPTTSPRADMKLSSLPDLQVKGRVLDTSGHHSHTGSRSPRPSAGEQSLSRSVTVPGWLGGTLGTIRVTQKLDAILIEEDGRAGETDEQSTPPR